MRVLLLAMPDSGWGFDEVCKVPNLGISSLAGNLDEEIKVGMADLVLVKKKFRKYVKYFIKKFKPDLVGLSCMTFQYQTAIKISRMIKDIDDSIKIAHGGYHPTLTYKDLIKSEDSKYIDFVIRGEGEATLNELTKSLQGKFDIRKIKGLTYKTKNNRFINNKNRCLLKPEQIKIPNRKDRFLNIHKMFMKKVDIIETSRGCIFKCKFCSIVHMYGTSFRDFTTERICEDISNAKKQGTKILMITDFDEIIVISAYTVVWLVKCGDFNSVSIREFFREKKFLNVLGNLELTPYHLLLQLLSRQLFIFYRIDIKVL